MNFGAQLELVGSADDLPEYPISHRDRLDSHYFLQWNLKRWRGSDFRRRAYDDPEVGFYGFELFCQSQDETPVGTLPMDDAQLAFCLHLSLEKWRSLCKRDLSPLHGWSPVLCDNGQTRLAHPVVTEIALDALGSRQRNIARAADDRLRKRMHTIRRHLSANIAGGSRSARDDDLIGRINDWIERAYPGGSATVGRVKEAWQALSM